MNELISTFNIHDYHFIWYILCFIVCPRVALAVLLSIYCPIALLWKVIAWTIVVLSGVKINILRDKS